MIDNLVNFFSKFLAKSRFVVKINENEPSEKYWLSLLRIWLRILQHKLDRAVADGLVSDETELELNSSEIFIRF